VQNSRGPSLETINGVVTPDLPIKTSLVEYFHSLELKHLFPSLGQKKETSEFQAFSDSQSSNGALQGLNCWQVRTVAAQTRSLPELQERMMKASKDIEVGSSGGSLLLLSGGNAQMYLSIRPHHAAPISYLELVAKCPHCLNCVS